MQSQIKNKEYHHLSHPWVDSIDSIWWFILIGQHRPPKCKKIHVFKNLEYSTCCQQRQNTLFRKCLPSRFNADMKVCKCPLFYLICSFSEAKKKTCHSMESLVSLVPRLVTCCIPERSEIRVGKVTHRCVSKEWNRLKWFFFNF